MHHEAYEHPEIKAALSRAGDIMVEGMQVGQQLAWYRKARAA